MEHTLANLSGEKNNTEGRASLKKLKAINTYSVKLAAVISAAHKESSSNSSSVHSTPTILSEPDPK